MKKFFKKIVDWFKRLIKKEKEIVHEVVETIDENVSVELVESENNDDMKEKDFIEETIEFEVKELPFSKDIKETILGVIRPIIKDFNDNDIYKFVCQSIGTIKTIKTFATMSDDNKELKIYLTQNKEFNLKINDFIKMHMISTFEYAINSIIDSDRFLVECEEGCIIIKKIAVVRV